MAGAGGWREIMVSKQASDGMAAMRRRRLGGEDIAEINTVASNSVELGARAGAGDAGRQCGRWQRRRNMPDGV